MLILFGVLICGFKILVFFGKFSVILISPKIIIREMIFEIKFKQNI